MTPELFLDKAVNASLVLGFFAAAIWFLRYLYGPGGKLRDPEWDRWNDEADAERLRKVDAQADAAYEQAFLEYGRSFLGDDAAVNDHVRLKMEHSLRVLAHARELAACEESLAPRFICRPLVLAAQFHDVGRFEQLRRYNTFADDVSCNHGLLGARVLHEKGFLQAEAPDIRRAATALVALHNRFTLPERLVNSPKAAKRLLALKALRDADKLDILYVMVKQLMPGQPLDKVILLNAKDQPDACNPAVVAALREGRTALYRDIRYVNDFRMVLCTWLHDLHFATSLRLAASMNVYPAIVQGLEGVPQAKAEAEALVQEKLGPFLATAQGK